MTAQDRLRDGATSEDKRNVVGSATRISEELKLPFAVRTEQRPTAIDNYAAVRSTPLILTCLVGLMAAATLGHLVASVSRRRRRDLALCAALDMRRAQRSGAVVSRCLSSVSGLFAYLAMCGEIGTNPVPRGLATRRPGRRGMAPVRRPMLPKVLAPAEVDAPSGTGAMVLAGRAPASWACESATWVRAGAGCSRPRSRAATTHRARHQLRSSGRRSTRSN